MYNYGQGMEKYRYGNSDVTYGPDGRLVTAGKDTYPRRNPPNQYPSNNRVPASEMNYMGRHRAREYQPPPPQTSYNQPSYPQYPPSNYGSRQLGQRRTSRDPRDNLPFLPYASDFNRDAPQYNSSRGQRQYPHPGDSDHRYPTEPREKVKSSPMMPKKNKDTNRLISERYGDGTLRYQRDRSSQFSSGFCRSVTYILIAIVMAGVAIGNILVCTDYHAYCGFWTALVALEAGIIGLLCRKRKPDNFINIHYVVSAIVLSVVSLASAGLILHSLVPRIITFDSAGRNTSLAAEVLGSDENNVISSLDSGEKFLSCFVLDIILLSLMVVCTTGVFTAAKVLEKYWRTVWFYQDYQDVKPFCTPVFFNPFAQIPFGLFMIMSGLVIISLDGVDEVDLSVYYSPIWAGVLVIFAGFLAAAAQNQPHVSKLNYGAIFLEFLALFSCIATLVLNIIAIVGVIDKLEALNSAEKVLLADACFFALADIFALISIFYSSVIIIKIVRNHMLYARNRTAKRSRDYESRSGYSRSVVSSREDMNKNKYDPPYGYSRDLYGRDTSSGWQRY